MCVSIQATENVQSAQRPKSEGIFFSHNIECGKQGLKKKIMAIGCGTERGGTIWEGEKEDSDIRRLVAPVTWCGY